MDAEFTGTGIQDYFHWLWRYDRRRAVNYVAVKSEVDRLTAYGKEHGLTDDWAIDAIYGQIRDYEQADQKALSVKFNSDYEEFKRQISQKK